MMNQIIARYQDGRVLRGQTMDFVPAKDRFHLVPAGAGTADKPLEVSVGELKGVFFVKDLQGNRLRKKDNAFDPNAPAQGRKIRVVFKDGEVLQGYTQGYQPGRPGFFVIPADRGSNTERCFVVSSATKEVNVL
jgi:hypothetical protein